MIKIITCQQCGKREKHIITFHKTNRKRFCTRCGLTRKKLAIDLSNNQRVGRPKKLTKEEMERLNAPNMKIVFSYDEPNYGGY